MIAGLSAAHELAERGFQVHVYERKPVLGGKARSIPVPNSGAGGRLPLPGEHGFRFFPGFYKHVTDTMRRTPYGANGNTSRQSEHRHPHASGARRAERTSRGSPGHPETLEDLRARSMGLFTPLGVPLDELSFFVSRLLTVGTSCAERRTDGIRKHRLVGFHRGAAHVEGLSGISRAGHDALAGGDARRGEQHAHGGRTQLQLLYWLHFAATVFSIACLSGPTNDVWIDPWTQYLQKLGVEFHAGC